MEMLAGSNRAPRSAAKLGQHCLAAAAQEAAHMCPVSAGSAPRLLRPACHHAAAQVCRIVNDTKAAIIVTVGDSCMYNVGGGLLHAAAAAAPLISLTSSCSGLSSALSRAAFRCHAPV
jgi:hypothetical protein